MRRLTILMIIFSLVGCSVEQSKEESRSASVEQSQQLNITILLDLSDRIDPDKYPAHPHHFERDLAIVKYIAELFVADMKSKGTYMAKGKLKVIFSPIPDDPNVNEYAKVLSVDLSKMDNKQKKYLYDNLVSNFIESTTSIYQKTLEQKKWIGSDVWGFFKNEVVNRCIDRDQNYRNVLVLITDGYIYHEDSKSREGNRFTYLLPETINTFKLRNNANWEREIETHDFGLIAKRSDLNRLEILTLGISPSPRHKGDEDIIKKVLYKWFEEMNVSSSRIYSTNLPEYIKKDIEDFMESGGKF